MSEEVKQEGEFKVKKKPGRPKKLKQKEGDVVKLDLNKEVQEPDKVVIVNEEKVTDNTIEEAKEETAVIEEVVKPTINEIAEEIENKSTKKEELTNELPENVEKLVSFMKETGGDIEDYVRLNANYDNISDEALLIEYYKKNKPHLNMEEIEFLLEDKFSYDENNDDEKDITKKKLAIKEEIVKAKSFLDDLKGKYYDEIKLRPGITQEQQKMTEFFNRYNEEQESNRKKHEKFINNTNNFFTNEFKGFDFNLDERKFRYNVNKPENVADKQSNFSNFISKFMNDSGEITDYEGYHKAMYVAENADNIMNHFYQQGRADSIRDINSKSKNINSKVRESAPSDIYINGLKVKAVNGVDSSRLKFKTKNQT
jgi:hypothetical protein